MALKTQVQTMSGVMHEIWVEAKCTVKQVKVTLEALVGIASADQVLLRDCINLEDDDAPLQNVTHIYKYLLNMDLYCQFLFN